MSVSRLVFHSIPETGCSAGHILQSSLSFRFHTHFSFLEIPYFVLNRGHYLADWHCTISRWTRHIQEGLINSSSRRHIGPKLS